MSQLSQSDYAAHLTEIMSAAQAMHDAGTLTAEWWVDAYVAERRHENQTLFALARRLGYELDPGSTDGSRSSEAENSNLELAPEPKRLFNFMTPRQVKARSSPPWLIRDLLVDKMVSVIYAQSRSFKSYLALNIGAQLATGGQFWPGEPVRQMGVLAVVLEGGWTMRTRMLAWEKHFNRELPEEYFRQVEDWQDLTIPAERDNFIDNCRKLKRSGFPLGLITIDTGTKAMGGADATQHVEAKLYTDSANEIRRALDVGVISFMHTGKNEDAGIFGSNAHFTENDCVIKLTRADKHGPDVELRVEKQKGFCDGQKHSMTTLIVPLDNPKFGEPDSDRVMVPDTSTPSHDAQQAESRIRADALEIATLMPPNGKRSLNQVCTASAIAGGTFKSGGKYTDRIKAAVPEGESNARTVTMNNDETRSLWREGSKLFSKSSIG